MPFILTGFNGSTPYTLPYRMVSDSWYLRTTKPYQTGIPVNLYTLLNLNTRSTFSKSMTFYFFRENHALINFIETSIFPTPCKTNKKFDFLYFNWDFFVSNNASACTPRFLRPLAMPVSPGVRVYCYFYCVFSRKRRARRSKKPIQAFKRTKPIHYYYYYYYRYIILSTTDTRRGFPPTRAKSYYL